MKLLFCRHCTDVKALTQRRRFCSCRRSFGLYNQETQKVRYGGAEAMILGLPNEDIEILRGPASATTEYISHKIVVVAPFPGRKPATTVEYVG